MRSAKQLETRFVKAATAHGLATLQGDHHRANREATKLERYHTEMQEDASLAALLLSTLLQNDNASVRTWAAAFALQQKLLVNEAIDELEKTAQDKTIGLVAFDAKMVLSRWRDKTGAAGSSPGSGPSG
jgi:hypothetical protein